MSSSSAVSLKIGIVGFDSFTQFLAVNCLKQGHSLSVTSGADSSELCLQMGAQFYRSVRELLNADTNIVIITRSIPSFTKFVSWIPFPQRPTLLAILSMEQQPIDVPLQEIPIEWDVLCTHVIFGTESGVDGWEDLTINYNKIRVRNEHICCRFLQIFESQGCRMLQKSCDQHNRAAARLQISLPKGVQFELQTLPVDPRAVADGDTITVYVSTADPRESLLVPTQVQNAALQRSEARAQRNFPQADALHQKIINAGYRVLNLNNEEILAKKYRIRLRGIDAPECQMPFGDEAKNELPRMVERRCLRVLVYGEDRYSRSVGDVYSNGIFVQEMMLKKGCAWHYTAYDRRKEFSSKPERGGLGYGLHQILRSHGIGERRNEGKVDKVVQNESTSVMIERPSPTDARHLLWASRAFITSIWEVLLYLEFNLRSKKNVKLLFSPFGLLNFQVFFRVVCCTCVDFLYSMPPWDVP